MATKSDLKRVSTGSTGGAGTGGKMLKKATPKSSGGMGYTRTGTDRKTGKKTTTSGVLTPVTKAQYNSNGSAGKAPSMSTGNKSTIKKKIY